MQAYFGPAVFSAESDLNWSVQMNPTELGKTLIFNKPWFYYALPICTPQTPIGCIEAVSYRRNGDSWQPAKLSNRKLRSRIGETAPGSRNANGILSTQEIQYLALES